MTPKPDAFDWATHIFTVLATRRQSDRKAEIGGVAS